MSQEKNTAIKWAKLLREEIPLRDAVQRGSRVEYFRGRRFVEHLMENEKLRKKMEKAGLSPESKEEAARIGTLLLQNGQIHRSEVKDKRKRLLEPVRSNVFADDGYYFWIYQGSTLKRNVLLGILITCFLSLTLFPVWPVAAKVAIWYVSVTLLVFIVGLSTVRLLVFGILYTVGIDFWILPNLFIDELSFMESITPVYSLERGTDKSEWVYRIATLAFFIGFGIWVYNQPTDFDEFVSESKGFMDDLYAGTLLSDVAQADKEKIDRVIPTIQELEEQERLERESEEAENSILDDLLDADEAEEDEDEDEDEEGKEGEEDAKE